MFFIHENGLTLTFSIYTENGISRKYIIYMLEDTIRSFSFDKSLTISIISYGQPKHLRRFFDFNNYQVDYLTELCWIWSEKYAKSTIL